MGAWWGFGDRHNDQSIYSTANHGPPPCSGPGASAPPSPMVNLWASAVERLLYFRFHSWQFARRPAGYIRGDACSINAVISDYYISAYNTLTRLFFNILGGVKCTYVVSTSRCFYTCPVSSGMSLRHEWFERSDLNPSRKRFRFGGLVFSRSDSCPTRENAWSEQV